MNLPSEMSRRDWALSSGHRHVNTKCITVFIISVFASLVCYWAGQSEFLIVINFSIGLFFIANESRRAWVVYSVFDEKLAKAFEAVPVPMWIFEIGSLKYIEINASVTATFGYSRTDFLAGKVHRKIMVRQQYHSILQELKRHGKINKMETDFYNKEGVMLSGLLSVEKICIAGTYYWLGVWYDIAQIKAMKRETQRLDRFNVVSKMAVSLAHEIRNPLTTVRGFLQLAEQRSLLTPDDVRMMISEIDRANAIITQFLFMAKERMSDFKWKDINKIINEMLPLVEKEAADAGHSVVLQVSQIPLVLVDEDQITQMLLNLIRNGLEAMRAKGKLLIRTYTADRYVVLAVSDEGPGIAPEIIEQIGTPFFTTKEDGTGLGLAVCYSIAARHGARIKIDSSQQGTTFNIQFKATG